MANINKELNDIKNAVYGREVRGSIHDGIKKINEEVENTTDRQDSVEAQFQSVLDETTGKDVISAPEINAAKVGADNTNYPNLKERLDTEHNQLSSQLAQANEEIYHTQVQNRRKIRGVLTITNDDNHISLYDELFPVVKEKNFPISAAINTGSIGAENNITLEHIKEMNESGLVEFMSHGVGHYRMPEIPLEQAEYELRESKKWLMEHGLDSDFYVYPFGLTSPEVINLVKKYYKGAYRTWNQMNYPPIHTYLIRRYPFEDSIESHKTRLEWARDEKIWYTIAIHSGYDTFSQEKLREIVDYAREIGVEIVTTKEAMRTFGNLVESDQNGERGGIDAYGRGFGTLGAYKPIPSGTGSPNAEPRYYQVGTTTMFFTTAQAQFYGLPGPGTLVRFRPNSDNYIVDLYYIYRSTDVRMRHYIDGDWSEWSDNLIPSPFPSSLDPNVDISYFKKGESIKRYTITESQNFDLPSHGVVKTIRPESDSFSFQILYGYQSLDSWYRYWNGSEWSEWVKR